MTHPRQKIFFLHIPKTAGYTFHNILFRQYPRTHHALMHSIPRTKNYLKLSPRKQRNTGVVRGHFLFGLHRRPGDTGICLTFLREPVARTISGYEFIYEAEIHPFHKQMHANKYSLYDFLDQGMITNFDNMHVRYLCGDDTMPYGSVNETHLERAWENLMSEDVLFGLTERFDETVMHFKEKLDAPFPYYERMNVGKNRWFNQAEMDEKTLQKIHQVNQYDFGLYRRAKKVFEERMTALGPDFAARVAVFKETNKTFKEPRYNIFQRFRNFMHLRMMLD